MPGRLLGLSPNVAAAELAISVALVTIVAMIGWEKWRPKSMKLVPGALVGVVAGTLVAWGMGLEVARVTVPASITAAISLPEGGLLSRFLDPSILIAALAIAFIASAETLLSAAAVDRMHDGPRTDYNKELRAQGIGNLLCGFAGALPMTGVIVRSSANVQAGATSRLSAMLHGVWILGFVALLPWLLREIPMAALGAVLVVTGWRLVNFKHATHLLRDYGPLPAAIWAITLLVVVAEDLLTGVLVGIALSLIELLPHWRRLGLKLHHEEQESESSIRMAGTASFLTVPKLTSALDDVPADRAVKVDVTNLAGVDHTSAEIFRDWVNRRRAGGSTVVIHGVTAATGKLAAA
jgi:MFS superfamily sulfate permease-like transporter